MKAIKILALLIFLISCQQKANKIYQWRGENREGIYPSNNLLKEWPEQGPVELWSIDSLGRGYGSPVFTEDHFYVCGEIDSMAILHCFKLDGTKVWHTILGDEWVIAFPGARSTPTIVDNFVYIGSGFGDLYCVNKKDGSIIWSKSCKNDFDGIDPLHGHSESPVVHKNKVFWNPGGKIYNVVALDRFTGDLIWSNPGFEERSAYNQGQLIDLPERDIYVTFSAYYLMGFDADTGEMLWSQEQLDIAPEKRRPGNSDGHMNSVLYENGFIYYTTVAGKGAVCLSLSEDGTQIDERWINVRFLGFMGGTVKLGDYIYGSSYVCSCLKSIEATTGVIRDSLNLGRGALISADNLFYYYTNRGDLKLIQPDYGNLKEVSSFKITKGTSEHFSHPVIHNGVLYLRRGQNLMAYDLQDRTIGSAFKLF